MKVHPMDKFLPPMRCDKGCGECCGIAPAAPSEMQRIAAFAKANGIEPIRQGTTCPWFQGGTCAVYPVRPWTCRMFGHVPELECPKGYNANVTSKGVMERLRQLRPDGIGLMHEVCYSLDEIKGLIAGLSEVTIEGRSIAS